MASSVTMQFFKASWSSSAGMAVISFDLPSTQRWPSTRPCSLAQALTRCRGPCARPWSNERRSVLPSIATTSRSKPATSEPAQAREAGLEGVRVDQHEDAPEGVVRGNAVRQLQEGLQPGQLAAAIERDVVPALGTGDHRADRNDQDVDQPMLDLAAQRGSSTASKCCTRLSIDMTRLLPARGHVIMRQIRSGGRNLMR